MPVRKPATAKKSAAKPLAKKVAAAKTKTPAKKTAALPPTQTLGQRIAGAISNGDFDGDLGILDDALIARSNSLEAKKALTEQRAAKKSASTAPVAKTVASPPKKVAPTITVEPKPNTTYSVGSSLRSLAGAKVKFIRFKAESSGEKSVVEMLTDKPGNPKGKKVVIPTAALVESPAPRRTPVKRKK